MLFLLIWRETGNICINQTWFPDIGLDACFEVNVILNSENYNSTTCYSILQRCIEGLKVMLNSSF